MMKTRFTLIELLVCIAVIMILVAMLMPALGRVRRRAMSVACLNNLKQCGMGITQMAASNDNKFVFVDGAQGDMILKWGSDDIRPDLDDYIDWNVWKCTFFKNLPNADSPLNTGNVFTHYYYFPGQDYYYKKGSKFYTSHKLQKNGANNVLMQDLVYYFKTGLRNTHGQGKYTVPYSYCPSYAWYKEGVCEGANMVYADGHATWTRFQDMDMVGKNSDNAEIYSDLP